MPWIQIRSEKKLSPIPLGLPIPLVGVRNETRCSESYPDCKVLVVMGERLITTPWGIAFPKRELTYCYQLDGHEGLDLDRAFGYLMGLGYTEPEALEYLTSLEEV